VGQSQRNVGHRRERRAGRDAHDVHGNGDGEVGQVLDRDRQVDEHTRGAELAAAQAAVVGIEDDARGLRSVRRIAAEEAHRLDEVEARVVAVLQQVVERQEQRRVAGNERHGKADVARVLLGQDGREPGREAQELLELRTLARTPDDEARVVRDRVRLERVVVDVGEHVLVDHRVAQDRDGLRVPGRVHVVDVGPAAPRDVDQPQARGMAAVVPIDDVEPAAGFLRERPDLSDGPRIMGSSTASASGEERNGHDESRETSPDRVRWLRTGRTPRGLGGEGRGAQRSAPGFYRPSLDGDESDERRHGARAS
jgi:hypothetical protein